MKIFVLFGSRSPEHEVSVLSALNVINALDRSRYEVWAVYLTQEGAWRAPARVERPLADGPALLRCCTQPGSLGEALAQMAGPDSLAFPVIHGPYGEDGTLQGLLEMAGIPYAGCGVLASAAAMDKGVMKAVFAQAGIPQAASVTYRRSDGDPCLAAAQVEQRLGYPCYVKPANMGSSIGISRASNRAELRAALEEALRYDDKVILEEEIQGQEVMLALLGNGIPRCSQPGLWVRDNGFFEFHDKYYNDAIVARIPVPLPEGVSERLQALACRAFQALEGSGLMRADFFVTPEGVVCLNEVNTLPGFTEHSMYPQLCRASFGLDFPELLDELIRLGWQRHEGRARIQTRRTCA